MGSTAAGRPQRAHKPREMGPRLYRSSGGAFGADFRYLGKGRLLLRNPEGQGWTPDARDGEMTESEEVAREWVTDYLRAWREKAVKRQLGTEVQEQPKRRLQDCIDRYLDDREVVQGWAVQTVNNDRSATSMLRRWYGPDADPAEISTAGLQQHFDQLLRDGMARSTLTTRRASLAGFFAWCKTPTNPAREAVVKGKGRKSKKKRGWNAEEIERLRKAADQLDREGEYRISARFTVELALGTGLREGELFAVEGRRFNVAAHTLKVVHQMSRYGGITETKGRDVGTTFVLPDYWPHHRDGVKGYLLANPDGTPIHLAKERGILLEVMTRAGLKNDYEGNHMFRHTYARLFLEEYEGDLRDLQKFLRHKSIQTTEQFYGHYSVDVAVERANERIYGIPRLRRVG